MTHGQVRFWSTAGEGKHAEARHNNGIPTDVFIRDNGDYTGKHRGTQLRIIDRALGPGERGVHWVDRAGDEWRSIGSQGEPYKGYGALWQCSDRGRPWKYLHPAAEFAPYRELRRR